MSTKPSNHSGNQDQGAFGDQDKQQDKMQTDTHLDNDSVLNVGANNKRNPEGSKKQSSMDNDKPIDRKDD